MDQFIQSESCEQIKSDHICLSCGKAMRLARTTPGIGELPELRTYDCKGCGLVFTESVGRAEWRESVGV
jgi:rubredoxin